jgi:hypothetical protein
VKISREAFRVWGVWGALRFLGFCFLGGSAFSTTANAERDTGRLMLTFYLCHVCLLGTFPRLWDLSFIWMGYAGLAGTEYRTLRLLLALESCLILSLQIDLWDSTPGATSRLDWAGHFARATGVSWSILWNRAWCLSFGANCVSFGVSVVLGLIGGV